jgi:hypothetical protein
MLTAAKHNIPSGFRKNFIPNLPPDAIPLVNRRDVLRQQNPNNPEILTLNNNIQEAICVSSRQKWAEKLESSTFRDNPSKFWSLLKSLSGKKARPRVNQPTNQPTLLINHFEILTNKPF